MGKKRNCVSFPVLKRKKPAKSSGPGKRLFRWDSKSGQLVEIEQHGISRCASSGWPILSDAAGVAASQVAEAREHSKKIGIPTDFTPDGRAILRNRKHRKEYCEAIGLYDRNGGYSDPQRK